MKKFLYKKIKVKKRFKAFYHVITINNFYELVENYFKICYNILKTKFFDTFFLEIIIIFFKKLLNIFSHTF